MPSNRLLNGEDTEFDKQEIMDLEKRDFAEVKQDLKITYMNRLKKQEK
jgi:hypothetical protein